MNENKDNAPPSNLNVTQLFEELNIASQGQRFITMIIDIFFYFIFALIAGVIIALVGFGEGLQNMNDNLLGILLLSCYFIPQEALFGRTLGKLITKTKVVKIDGSKVTFNDVLIRTLCRFIPFEPFSFFGNNGRPRGWHDRISKTSVISLK